MTLFSRKKKKKEKKEWKKKVSVTDINATIVLGAFKSLKQNTKINVCKTWVFFADITMDCVKLESLIGGIYSFTIKE